MCEEMDINHHPNCDAAGYGCAGYGKCGIDTGGVPYGNPPKCGCLESHPPPPPPGAGPCGERTSEAACADGTSTCSSSDACVWIPTFGQCQCATAPSCETIKDEAKCSMSSSSCSAYSTPGSCTWIPAFSRCGCATEAVSAI